MFRVFLIAVLFISAPVAAQDRDLLNRLNRLENEVQTLNDATFGGNPPRPAMNMGSVIDGQKSGGMNHLNAQESANVEVRIGALERELQQLTGKIEEMNFKMQQLQTQMQNFVADTNMRFQDSQEQQAAAQAEAVQKPKKTIQVTDPTPTLNADSRTNNVAIENVVMNPVSETAEAVENTTTQTLGQLDSDGDKEAAAAAYDAAFALLRQGEYERAGKAFSDFLAMYRGHSLTANAMYWLAETHYVQGEYERAAKGFAEGYKQYPNSNKAADNLLKLGLSLASLDRMDEACVTLQQVQEKTPNAPLAVKRRAEQELAKLSCS